MARGLPDYFKETRPRFGGAQDKSSYNIVTANDETILATITGKGVIYGGFIKLKHTATQKNSGIFVYVDEEKLGVTDFEDLELHGLTVENSYPFYLRKYDDVNFRYCVALSRDITFETKLEISYVETHGETPKVWYRVIYALI